MGTFFWWYRQTVAYLQWQILCPRNTPCNSASCWAHRRCSLASCTCTKSVELQLWVCTKTYRLPDLRCVPLGGGSVQLTPYQNTWSTCAGLWASVRPSWLVESCPRSPGMLSDTSLPAAVCRGALPLLILVGVGGIGVVLHKSFSPAELHPSRLIPFSSILIFLACFFLLGTKVKIRWLGTRTTMTWIR